MTDKLKPCPFCGTKKELFVEFCSTTIGKSILPKDHPDTWWRVMCVKCGADGPVARPGESPAIAAWNKRQGENDD